MATSTLPRRSRRFRLLLSAAALCAAPVAAFIAPSAAAGSSVTAPVVSGSRVDTGSPWAATSKTTAAVPLSSLAMTGTTTTITVHRVFRRGQVQWINHVISTRLVNLDGCQARRGQVRWTGRTYSTTVRTVCTDGPARAEAAARDLVKDRPWYRIQVARVSLVGFSLLADTRAGNGEAVPAALAQLPTGSFTFAEGDDVSLNYVGRGVTQTQLDDAVAAFARALDVPVSAVRITPIAS